MTDAALISRLLGDAGHARYQPVDDPAVHGGPLAHADRNPRAAWQAGYRVEQQGDQVRVVHEGPDRARQVQLYALALGNLGHHVQLGRTADRIPYLTISEGSQS
ncbi:hypothetical protein ACWGNN_00770 [Streptomyces sp. NPDC055817]